MTAMRVDAKVVMLGKESVGKTSLVERYVHGRFLVGPYQNTIGAAFVAKALNVGDKVVTLGIWDTAGSERYEAMSRIYYRGARAAIVCYDLTDSSSFGRARFWVKELQNCEEHCKIYLCGTKSDLIEADRSVRQVDYHDVQDFADEIGAQHFETSSKTGKNVDEVFQKVAEDFSSCALEFMQGGSFRPVHCRWNAPQHCPSQRRRSPCFSHAFRNRRSLRPLSANGCWTSPII
uniref:Ras-related protein Rab-24 n=1 Tax=Sinocyclocheilus anshuiensis TaxID=1608454 RepID=A0A671MJP3_9TELE